MSEQATKTCIWCKQDCSATPRQKDLKGNYLCKECVEPYQKALTERAKQRRPEHAIPTVPLAGDSAVGTGDVLVGMIDQTVDAQSEACPSCSRMLAPEAMICTHCGYNKRSGRQMKSHVETLKREKGESKSMQAASAVADTASFSLLIGTIICCVGGLIGAAAWAAVAYYTGYEISYLAIGVGLLAGAGMMAGSRGYSGLPTGLIAAGVATVAIMAGKYTVVSYFIDDYTSQASFSQVVDHDGIVDLADEIIYEKESQGETLDWPDGMTIDEAYAAEDYPTGIWTEADQRWSALSQAEKDQRLDVVRARLNTVIAMAKEEGFLASFGMIDILFFGLAIFTAFGLGSGGTLE